MANLNCIICHNPEISKLVNGKCYEPKADKVKKKKSVNEVNARTCGSCVQNLMNTKTSIIPWDGVIEKKQANDDQPIRRQRRKSL